MKVRNFKILFGIAMLMTFVINSNAQSSLGIGTTAPDASSMLDVTSTSKGVLVPRVALTGTTDVTTIPLAAPYTFIYNTATAGSVPYNVGPAFYYWNTTWVIIGGFTNHYVGESYGGGIVFYIYDDGMHGLISAPNDQGSNTDSWDPTASYLVTNAVRDGIKAGQYNTDRIMAKQGLIFYPSHAAQICASYTGSNFSDWYLPSQFELNLLYNEQATVGGFTGANYWSSNEDNGNTNNAWVQDFSNGNVSSIDKADTNCYLRAIRAF
jgi:hypothetical protein